MYVYTYICILFNHNTSMTRRLMFHCRDHRENIAGVDLVLKVNLVYKFQYRIYSPYNANRFRTLY